jgi:4-alpha-glucanotransferase
MNLTASHDIDRTRTALAVDFEARDTTRDFQAAYEITPEMAAHGARLQKLAAALQFSLPGIPSIYYGDEAGMMGFCDPFCRAPYHMEDADMLQWYTHVSALRNAHAALRTGAVAVLAPAEDAICVLRSIADGRDVFGKKAGNEALLTVVNRAARTVTCSVELTAPGAGFTESERLAFLRMGYTKLVPVDGGETVQIENGRAKLKLPACSAVIYKLEE